MPDHIENIGEDFHYVRKAKEIRLPYYAKPKPVHHMSPSTTTIECALADAAKRFAEVSDSPRLDAKILLAWVLDALKGILKG